MIVFLDGDAAAIFEVTKTTPPTTVWQMQIAGQYAYRGIRILNPLFFPNSAVLRNGRVQSIAVIHAASSAERVPPLVSPT